jgi:type 1 glutamine amidotransferase
VCAAGTLRATVLVNVAPPAPVRTAAAPVVLVVDDARGFVHDSIPAARHALVRTGRRDGRRMVVLAAARELTAARLSGADAVAFVQTSGDPPLGPGGRERLVRFVRRGGGLVLLHAASTAFERWPTWSRIVGARFVAHAPFGPAMVSVTRDVATRRVPLRFSVADELYEFDRDPRRSGARILARQAGGDRRPLAWRRHEGRGRVFHSALGHPVAAWADGDPRLALVRAGARWASSASSPTATAAPGSGRAGAGYEAAPAGFVRKDGMRPAHSPR